MDSFSVRLRMSLLFVFGLINKVANAQNCDVVVDRLYHIEDSVPPKNANYIIITNKNCHACFGQLCEYYKQHNISGDIYGIVVMDKNYLALLSIRAKYKNEIPCLKDIYFLFTERCIDFGLETILSSPSPQLLLHNEDTLLYRGYTETMQMIKKTY